MNEIKFRYVAETISGTVIEEVFPLRDIQRGYVRTWLKSNDVKHVISRDLFTGVKDRAGIDIYENDWFDIKGRVYNVFYQDANFRLVDNKSNKSLSAGCVNIQGLVIGNIHEQKGEK